MSIDRREFLALSAVGACVTVFAGKDEKEVDGGLAEVSEPGVPQRKRRLLPPGAQSFSNFASKCTACGLCITACPEKVLRPSLELSHLGRPEMGFEHGWCRPECVKCSQVCPTGAIRRLVPHVKENIHVGHAVWHRERCVAVAEGLTCTACERHCPAGAITLVSPDPTRKDIARIPVVDRLRCLGCGACENLCPARPLPAMTVSGFEVHREVKPMGDDAVLGEARRLFAVNKAAVVLVKNGVIVASGGGRGLYPLLDLMDMRPVDFAGCWVIDKVIGKAAAAICIAGGAKRVHGELMCEPAVELLRRHGIPFSSDKLVPQILNRAKDGLCPLETSVKDLTEVPAMITAIRRKLLELKSTAPKPEAPKN